MKLTMPWTVLILGVLAILAWIYIASPDRYDYRNTGPSGMTQIRVDKKTGNVERWDSGEKQWKPR